MSNYTGAGRLGDRGLSRHEFDKQRRRAFQAEGTANTEAWRQESVWHVLGSWRNVVQLGLSI